jgi:hypothetical protein
MNYRLLQGLIFFPGIKIFRLVNRQLTCRAELLPYSLKEATRIWQRQIVI